MAQTVSSALSAAITFKTTRKVLENLRSELFWADPGLAERGERLGNGFDTLLFTNVPELTLSTTPISEGIAPTPRALTMGTVTISTSQYAGSVSISDVAKAVSPIPIVETGAERLSFEAKRVIDQVTRDVIAGGGTPFYADAVANRAALAAANKADVADLKRLSKTMSKAGIPRFSDGWYHLMCSPEVALDISNDAAFTESYKYVDNTPLLKNEVGRIAGFRVQEVANAPTFSSTVTVAASIAVGAIHGWGAGEIQSLSTHHVAPGGDHADLLALDELMGWKVMFGVGVLSNARYYRLESAFTAL